MPLRVIMLLFLLAGIALAQPACPATPLFTACDLVLELTPEEMQAHPNPYLTVDLRAEFRSPGITTFLLPAFWDGGNRFVVRFAPTEVGKWLVRFSGNIKRLDGSMSSLEATASSGPGFLEPANAHHWRTVNNKKPHLWMGDTLYTFATMPEETFQAILAKRKTQGFTHIRGYLHGPRLDDQGGAASAALPAPDQISPVHFQQLDRRVRAMNDAGIIADLILGWDRNHLADALPTRQQRERFLDYVVARYSAFNVTWQIAQEFEEYEDGRVLMKELGDYLKQRDPYNHPRTAHTVSTTSPLAKDGWMTYMLYQSSDDQLGAIEHQLYQMPFVNAEFGYENSGAGATHAHHVDGDTFRKRLWNATMNGQYPTFGNTGTYGGKFGANAKFADSPGAGYMKVWADFMSRARYWELEPYFDVSGARCLALWGEDTPQFICYVENPGTVELRFAKKNKFNIEWMDPSTGAVTPMKEFKDEFWTGAPPDSSHDWVLHIYREGRLKSLGSYYFESRLVPIQEPDNNAARLPFEIAEPANMVVPVADTYQAPFAIKLTRESRATRQMMYLWIAEDTVTGQGHRVAATGDKGFMRFRKNAIGELPVVVNVRIYGMNAVGKVYFVDKVYRLTP